MNIRTNITESKKDLVKAGNTTLMFKDCIGDTFNMTGVIIYDKEEIDSKTGEVSTKIVSCVKREDGEFISTISPTVENSLSLIVNSYEPEEIKAGLAVMIKTKKSNGGRDFIYIDLV
jgi:hypothetical protein